MSKPVIYAGSTPKVTVVPSGGSKTIAVGEESVVVQPSEDNPVIVTPVSGRQGEPGPEGPTGPPGSASNGITFIQHLPAATWVIPHDLGYPPAVTVIDSSGSQIEGEAVLGPDLVMLTFSAAFAGTAYLS